MTDFQGIKARRFPDDVKCHGRRAGQTSDPSGAPSSRARRVLFAACGALILGAPATSARGPYGARDADYQMAVTQAHDRYQKENSGKVAPAISALGGVSPGHFGVVVVRIDGKVFDAGDARESFLIGELAAPFTSALAASQQGAGVASSTAGAVAGTAPVPDARTAADFGDAPYNPLVAQGALTTLSLVKPQRDVDGKWRALLDNFNQFAGRDLQIDERAIHASTPVMPDVDSMVRDLGVEGRLSDDAGVTAQLYRRQSALSVTPYDLAVMAATLANDGVNPVSGKAVVSPDVAQRIQAQMLSKRKGSSVWMAKEGIAAAAGTGGGIIVVIPGRLGLATYAPPLDASGVSVRGQRAVRYLSKALFFAPQ